MQTHFGKAARMSGSQSVMHVSWWEADAWARWAGRRLPTEVEWEMAAHTAARRGFRWGDVREWTATTLRPWPGFAPDAWTLHTDFAGPAAFRQRPRAARRFVRRALAHEAPEVPRLSRRRSATMASSDSARAACSGYRDFSSRSFFFLAKSHHGNRARRLRTSPHRSGS